MPKAVKGQRFGGRAKGVLNKRTLEKIEEASKQMGAIRKQGGKKAVEVLNELMQLAMNYTVRYHNKVAASENAGEAPNPLDFDRLMRGMQLAGIFAKNLADFQSPKFSTVKVDISTHDPAAPGDGAHLVNGKEVKVIDDAVSATRIYQQMVRRIG